MKKILLLMTAFAMITGCEERENPTWGMMQDPETGVWIPTIVGEWEITYQEFVRTIDGEFDLEWNRSKDDMGIPTKMKFQEDGTGFMFESYPIRQPNGIDKDMWLTVGSFSWTHSDDTIFIADRRFFFPPEAPVYIERVEPVYSEVEWTIDTHTSKELKVTFTVIRKTSRERVFCEHFIETYKRVN